MFTDNCALESGLLKTSPSNESISRESDKITFGGEYQISDDLQISSEINTSKGTSRTNQSQLNMGLDWDRNGNLNAIQWHGVVGYNFDGIEKRIIQTL